jgi:hypothetical protein
MLSLRKNQQEAVQTSLQNSFASGVHQHATGAGKSVIALELLAKFYDRYPTHNVMWICEQKSILIDQFDKPILKAKGYFDTIKKYLVLDYSSNKQQDWTTSVNSSKFWPKPCLIIINRAFLTSSQNYTKLNLPIHLILHDECHSIQNTTTQAFYKTILAKNIECRCIGFSATPTLTLAPFTQIISRYSIYDSVCDDVIVPPRILWTKSTSKLSDIQIAKLLYGYLQPYPYKKCIVWCGMIQHCMTLATLFASVFSPKEWFLGTDTSVDNTGYHTFYERKEKALLFCAAKHREGSDIPYLDSCLFLDRVEDRSHKVFVQCIGRVLRKDKEGKKTEGLIFDAKAKSSINVCNRMNTYLNDSNSSHELFPWHYESNHSKIDEVEFVENTLLLVPNVKPSSETAEELFDSRLEITWEEVSAKFVREISREERYMVRAKAEWDLFVEKKLVHHLLQAVKILELTGHIPHVTRGSCGSSYLCYLLGISNVDPIKYDICFARFLNIYRDTLPDIDFDFPHQLRDEVFLKLQLTWPGKIARISNHCYFHEKSAQREALRRIGKKGFLSKEDVPRIITELGEEEKEKFDAVVDELEDTFSHYALHCGGIVFFPKGVPDEILHKSTKNTNVLRQIVLNKQQVGNNKQFKVDILSSRALSQLHESLDYGEISFDAHEGDEKTAALLCRGDNVGLTLAESPLMRKAMCKFQPKKMEDVAMCLAVIRPAAKEVREGDDVVDGLVYDDDAIKCLVDTLGCSEDIADKLRRKLSKGDILPLLMKHKKEFKEFCEECNVSSDTADQLLKKLRYLRKYSFCKSHAYSYGQLVWQLAYQKANHPIAFWKATLHHAQSSYKRWVHLVEAFHDGYYVDPFNQQDRSIYSTTKRAKLEKMNLVEQLRAFGCWDLRKAPFLPDCAILEKEDDKVLFRGIFASVKRLSKTRMVCCVGVDVKNYIEVMCIGKNKWMRRGAIGIEGRGKIVGRAPVEIECMDFNFF